MSHQRGPLAANRGQRPRGKDCERIATQGVPSSWLATHSPPAALKPGLSSCSVSVHPTTACGQCQPVPFNKQGMGSERGGHPSQRHSWECAGTCHQPGQLWPLPPSPWTSQPEQGPCRAPAVPVLLGSPGNVMAPSWQERLLVGHQGHRCPTTHCGTRRLSGLLQGLWLGGLPGLCGVGGHEEPCAGPSGRWLASEPASRAAFISGLGL